jgi:hypothetical protein
MGLITPEISLDFYQLSLSNVYIAVANSDIIIQKSNGNATYKIWTNQDARLSNAFPLWSNVVNFEYVSDVSVYTSVYDQLKIIYPGSYDA